MPQAKSMTLRELEKELRALEGVVGAVVVDSKGSEVQIFANVPKTKIWDGVREVFQRSGREELLERAVVHELAGSSSGAQASAVRPWITSVSLSDAAGEAEARVSLVLGGTESEGTGRGEQTEHSLRVVAATTLEAAQAFIDRSGAFALHGVSLVEVLGQRMVLVLVESEPVGTLSLGAALVADGPVYEATVKASLDAVNRQISLMLGQS